MKKSKMFLFVILLLFPTIIFASNGEDGFSLGYALMIEAFVSIHMSIFVLIPLSKIFSTTNSKKLFWTLFLIRVVILLYFDFFVTTNIVIFDFIFVFIGAFFVVPISAIIKKPSINGQSNHVINSTEISVNNVESKQNLILKCAKCGSLITEKHKFCENCGEAIVDDNIKVELNRNVEPQKKFAMPGDFDSMFGLIEETMIYEFLDRELKKVQLDKNSKLIPSAVLKKRKILNIIFSLLTFVFVSLIFFHFPISTYICGIIILFFLFKFTRIYNFMEYLKKEVKSRPSEKVSNIVMNLKQTMVEDTSGKILLFGLLASIILTLIIFIKPMIWYEKVDGGYGVRYYIFGVTNFTSATIPEKHKGEDIIMLRGNTFSNMPFLKEVNLPDTITEIRGQAFKNNKLLKNIKLPSNLNYLGGGAFYGCSSLEEIEIPDSVTYIGGEAFYKATKLKSVKLPESLTEIRGNTFEYCRSLETIVIPDNVTRIGGHAFYGNSSLSSVTISENSQLTEIGSSAFRLCHNLYEITIPDGVYVNERAFKESPTYVKRYGEVSTYESSISDYSTYDSNNYSQYFYMNVGETEEINQNKPTANLQYAYITLVSINRVNDENEFNFKYSDPSGEVEFTLTRNNTFKQINNNLIIQISVYAEFVVDDNNLQFDAYFN